MTSKRLQLSVPWRAFRTAYEFLRPVVVIVALISAFLCCMTPKPGSPSRLISALILAGCILLLMAAKLVHKRQLKKDTYRLYRSRASRRLEPGELIPLCFITVVFMIPFYMVFITAFKNSVEANQIKFTWWPTQGFSFDSFLEWG